MSENVAHILDIVVRAAQYVADNAAPGWKESNYESALVSELVTTVGAGLSVQQQVTLRSYFRTSSNVEVETGALRPDLRVECRCLECDEIGEADLWQRHVYVELKLEPRGTLQQAHLDQARGYAIAASRWARQPIVCLALAFSGHNTIAYEAFAGTAGASVPHLVPKPKDLFDD